MINLIRQLKILRFITLFLLVGGCASGFIYEPIVTNFAGLGKPRVMLFDAQIIRGKDSYSLEMIVDISNNKLTLVGSSFGFRIFTLSYDGVSVIEGPGVGLPFYISNRLIIDDVMLILISRDVLKNNLPRNCFLNINGVIENIYCKERLLASITELPSSNGNSVISLKRSELGYELNIVMSEVR